MTWTAARRTPPADSTVTQLTGKLAQVRHVFENADSFSVVADLLSGECVRGQVESRTELVPGGDYRFLGCWIEHERFGWQFAFDAVLAEMPDDPDEIASYLSRHAEGVGLVTASKLVAAYGPDAVRVLVEDVERVIREEVMKNDAARIASASLHRVYADPALREAHLQLFSLMRGHGFYAKAIKAALRRWRASAPAQVRRDPFLMLTQGFPGCGFLKVDRLYLALKKNPRRLKRQALAAWYALSHLDGDTWANISEALKAVRTQIGGTSPREKRAVALLHRAGLAESRTDEKGQVWIAERFKAVSERACAHMIHALGKAEANWPDADTLGLDPATDLHQVEQLRLALAAPVSLLTGSPGTGKTHCASLVIRGIIKMVGAAKVAVCAPTGKAAVRITEKMAEAKLPLKATTIHGLLKVRPVETSDGGWGFEYGPENKLPYSHIVLDEGSMPDVGIMASLLLACTPGTNLLIVGDPHQLPPVGHGAFLRDAIAAGVPRGHLSEIRRNAGLIVRACHQIKDGKIPSLSDSLRAWPTDNLIQLPWPKEDRPTDRAKQQRDRLDELYDWLPRAGSWDQINDVQVITARNATRVALNAHLQQRLNAAGERGPVGKYRVGDKVICLKNGFVTDLEDSNHKQIYVANGDIGRVRRFSGRTMAVELLSPRRLVGVPLTKKAEEDVEAHSKEMGGEGKSAGSWDLAYCITAHKSQGSEMPVAIFIVEGAGKLGSRELIYTAISRAKDLCIILGDTADVRKYVRNQVLPLRKTFLRELLTKELPL